MTQSINVFIPYINHVSLAYGVLKSNTVTPSLDGDGGSGMLLPRIPVHWYISH